ncbi:ATP-binding cassette sub-family C member 9-like isoform X2 [Asterias amurensis]|uniref:ATP-binding cassette sub-family C member 9-like isoform X2 n=1 Tax=Asterias amurensis TaxID=7602 RepID=UPI003AB229DC
MGQELLEEFNLYCGAIHTITLEKLSWDDEDNCFMGPQQEQLLKKFNWYCGVNNSANFDNFTWDLDHTLYNTCFTDLVYTVPHLLFILLSVLVLLILGCCTRIRKEKYPYLIQYPGHNLRWILNFIFILLLLCQIGESILTNVGLLNGTDSMTPHLYIPSVFVLVAAILSMVYYTQMEVWRHAQMSWLLLAYWLGALASEVTRFLQLSHEFDRVDYSILRVDLNLVAIGLVSLFLILELNVIRTKIFWSSTKEDVFPEDLMKEDMRYMQGYSSLLSSAFLLWMNWIFKKGYKSTLEMADLGSLSEVHTTKYQRENFLKALKKEEARAKMNKKPLSLYRAYARAFGADILLSSLFKFVGVMTSFIPPLALAGAIKFVSVTYYGEGTMDYEQTKYITVSDFLKNGFVLIVVMFCANVVTQVLQQALGHTNCTTAAHMRIALQAAVYDKSLRLSSYTMTGGAMTMGQITNHMSVDTSQVADSSVHCFHHLWSIPFEIVGFLAILYTQLGVAALIGSCVFLIFIPLQIVLIRQAAKNRKKFMEQSDERLKKTNELLQGIKLIKLYGWEDIFYKAISKVRALEIVAMMKQRGWHVILSLCSSVSPLLVALVSFSMYTKLTGNPLTPDIAFTALAVFGQLSHPLIMIPHIVNCHINGFISTGRLRTFFEAPEIERSNDSNHNRLVDAEVKLNGSVNYEVGVRQRRKNDKEDKNKLMSGKNNNCNNIPAGEPCVISPSSLSLPDDIALRVRGNFIWDDTANTPTLRDMDLDIPAGKLTMIVGQVGCGKSSLLSAILGEMTTMSGGVHWNPKYHSVSFGAQKAWLLNASFRDNIIFNNAYDQSRYKTVLDSCSLQPDIDILPGGDQTEIGEKGINLSGGQKQRVSVGRAMYSYNDVVILDDPLSALDMHVGAHLFKEGIEGFLMRKSKRTVILVTHQTQYAEKADKIVYMKDGHILHQGTLQEIRDENPELVADWRATDKERNECESEGTDQEDVTKEPAKMMRQISGKMEEKKLKADGQLIEEEERAEGSVSLGVYLTYFKALGFWICLLQVCLQFSKNLLDVRTNYWLSDWSEAGNNLTTANATQEELLASLNHYLGGYAGFSVSSMIVNTASSALITIASLVAAKTLHNTMLKTVLNAPLRFFETTPVGRILNRFSSDTSTIDNSIAGLMNHMLHCCINCLFGVLVNVMVSWCFIIVLIPMALLYFLLLKIFISTFRDVQRLDSISKSPVYAHFSESLGGLSTIRAYQQQNHFQDSIVEKIDCNNLTHVYFDTCYGWLQVRLNLVSSIIVLLAGMSAMITALTTGTLAPSLVGLAITYALSLSSELSWMVQVSAYVEGNMNAVERVHDYTSLEVENSDGIVDPGPDWPDKGEIVYSDVSARYASDLDPVLHEIDVRFQPGKKIGICGRTGSGKSSLTLTLFRIIQTFKGKITVDGVNIADLPLAEVRRRFTIIPQDPVLFTGTIRFNLDARGEHDNDALWDALEVAQLKGVVSDLDLKLDTMVTEGGENFSVGQRQLFCLARAFLKKTRILVMDEATASIDLETDGILQDVVANAFKERTVLTIAHRVQTILDSDHILVLNEGQIAEYDTPQNLLAQEDSIFASLVKAGS